MLTMSRKPKYPQLVGLQKTDKNAYAREWRKLNPGYYKVKDEWRKLDKNTFTELPDDAIPVADFPTYYVRPNGEVWRDTRGYPSAVKSGKERVLKLTPTYTANNGYWIVQPYKDSIRKAIYLHRFILTAFKGPAPEPNMECHHIDHDTSNNAINNLMWVTRQENSDYVPNHKRRVRRITLDEGRSVSKSKHFSLFPEIIRLYKLGLSMAKIERRLGIRKSGVIQIVKALKKRGEL